MKYKSAKGTTINIPDGLSPKQIAAIKADADSGYGTRAQQTANSLGKRLKNSDTVIPPGNTNAAGGANTPGGPTTVNDNIDPKTGAIKDPQDVIDSAGHTFDPNDPYWQNLYNSTYNNQLALSTHGLDQRQARDLEAAKQEAADRGLPFDPGNRESAYGRAIGGVTDRYDDLYSQAGNQATAAAQGVFGQQAGLSNDAFVSQIQARFGISEADARAYALQLQKKNQEQDFQLGNRALAKKGSGGSSGGSNSSEPGFQIIG